MKCEGENDLTRSPVYSASDTEEEGKKRPCEDLVNSASAATAHLKRKRKCPCEDLAESPSSASASNASGQVMGKDSCAENLSPASATATGQVKGKHSCVVSLTSASATTTGIKAEVRGGRPSAYPSEYAYIEYPDANAYSEEIPYELFMEGGRLVAKIACRVYLEDNPHAPVTSEMPLMKGGIQPPPDLEYSFKGHPFYDAAVASGCRVKSNGRIWVAKLPK